MSQTFASALDPQAVKDALQGRWPDFYAQYTELHNEGKDWRGPCPLHDGKGRNFAVVEEDGNYYCQSQCKDGGDALKFLQLREGLSFPDALRRLADYAGLIYQQDPPTHPRKGSRIGTMIKNKTPLGPLAETYSYTDPHGALLFQTTRHQPKDFRQRRPDPDKPGAWLPNLNGVSLVLYRLPEVLAAVQAGRTVHVVEGEKDADALAALGLCATCNPLGAGKWRPAYTEALCGAGVVLLPDNDKPGRDHAQAVASDLHGQAARVRVVQLPDLPDKGDVSDWLRAGGTREALETLVAGAADYDPAAAPCHTDGDAWEPPVPFTAHALPDFPLEALPDALRHYVASAAHTLQVPPALPALLALAAVAAAAAPRCRVQVGTTHAEPLNLYCAAVMEPGSRKSAAMVAMAFPLLEAEREMIQDAAPSLANARETRAVQEKRQAHLQTLAAKEASPGERAKLLQELGELAAALADVPAAPRLLADDVTPEQLATLLAEQRGCMALFSAEGGIFGILAGRYSGDKVNLDLFLKGHAGDDVRVDRKARPPEHIPCPCLTIALTVQPDVLASLADTPAFRGRGLLGRFLYCLPDSLVGTRLYDPARALDPAARQQYARTVRALLALPTPATPDDPAARHTLRLGGEALAVWKRYADDVERRQADGADLAGVRDWASKLAGAVARLAAGMHLVGRAGHDAPWDTPIAAETVAAAWAVGEYLIPHALAAYGQMGADPRLTLARRILRWIEQGAVEEFSLRECHQHHRSVSCVKDLVPGLDILCERGYLCREEGPERVGPGRKKGPCYRVNPLHKLHKMHKMHKTPV